MTACCRNGHARTRANTYLWHGKRACRACRRVIAEREARERRSDAGLAELRAALRAAAQAWRAA